MEGRRGPEQGPKLSFDSQLALARALFAAEDKRKGMMRGRTLDDFVELVQLNPDLRAEYDKVEREIKSAQDAFERNVIDKKAFVEQLRKTEPERAEDIRRIFGLRKRDVLLRAIGTGLDKLAK